MQHNGVDIPCVAELDQSTRKIVYEQLVFNNGTLNGDTNAVTRQTLLESNSVPNPLLGSGTTFSLNTLANGETVLVFANVQSDSQIEIVEVDCT